MRRQLSNSLAQLSVAAGGGRGVVSLHSLRLQKRPFRPFSPADEQELSHLLATRPTDLPHYMRQRNIEHHNNVTHFRNMVTFMMIALQSKLHAKQLAAGDAMLVIEAILRECNTLRQGDLAHLLFRAALRFRKYGVVLSHGSVRQLYDAYRGDEACVELLRGIGNEFRHDPQMRTLAMSAYLFAGNVADAAAVKNALTEQEITTEDYVALIEGNGKLLNFSAVKAIAFEALVVENKNPRINAKQILSTAVIAARGSPEIMMELVEKAAMEQVFIGERAIGFAVRGLMNNLDTVADILREEAASKARFKVAYLGFDADATVLFRLGFVMARHAVQADEDLRNISERVQRLHGALDRILRHRARGTALQPPQQLQQQQPPLSDSQQQGPSSSVGNDAPAAAAAAAAGSAASTPDGAPSVDTVDVEDETLLHFFDALIRGYGAIRHTEGILQVLRQTRNSTQLSHDTRFTEEALRWLSYSGAVKDVIHVFDQTLAANIHPTSNMFLSVFRCMGRSYPAKMEQYYAIMKSMHIAKTAQHYPVLIRAFEETGNQEVVRELLAEVRAKQSTSEPILTSKLLCTLLALHSVPVEEKHNLVKDAAKVGLMADPMVQAGLVRFYSSSMDSKDLGRFLSALPHKSAHVYSALLEHHARARDRPAFEQCIVDLRRHGVSIGEKLYGMMVRGYNVFDDVAKVRSVFDEARQSGRLRHSHIFAHAAQAFARAQDVDSVDEVWSAMTATAVTIELEVYNRFLDIYAGFNRTAQMQNVLAVMMKNEAPNASTANTVLHMLGKMGRLSEMESVLEEMDKSPSTSPTAATYHQAMAAYAKNGDTEKMESTRAAMKAKGLQEEATTYDILVDGYSRAKRYDHIEALMRERTSKGIPLDGHSYHMLLKAFARGRREDRLTETVDQLLQSGIPLSRKLLSVIATSYGHIGDIARAEHYLALLLSHPQCTGRDVEPIFMMYARMRDTAKMEEILGKVDKTSNMLNLCVTSFAKAGDFVKVAALLKEMEERSFTLTPYTGLILSSLLVRAGKTELAHAVLQMKSVSTPVVRKFGDNKRKY